MKKAYGGRSLRGMVAEALASAPISVSPADMRILSIHIARRLGARYVKTRPGYTRLVAAAKMDAARRATKFYRERGYCDRPERRDICRCGGHVAPRGIGRG